MSNLILSVCMLISVTACIGLSFKYFKFLNAIVHKEYCVMEFSNVVELSILLCAYPIAKLWILL